jgi:hypothetical protein
LSSELAFAATADTSASPYFGSTPAPAANTTSNATGVTHAGGLACFSIEPPAAPTDQPGPRGIPAYRSCDDLCADKHAACTAMTSNMTPMGSCASTYYAIHALPMLRRCTLGAALVLALALWALPAMAQLDGETETPGASCPSGAVAGQAASANWDTIFECNASSDTWQRGPYFLGATSDTCDSNHAGMVQWTGSSVSPNKTFEFCNGTSWTTVNGAATSVPLSGIIAATSSANTNSGANAITWAWNSIASETALALTTTDLTSGTILQVENTSGGNSTGYAGYFENITTGAGYALYALTTGNGNTGYGVYGLDNSVSG